VLVGPYYANRDSVLRTGKIIIVSKFPDPF